MSSESVDSLLKENLPKCIPFSPFLRYLLSTKKKKLSIGM